MAEYTIGPIKDIDIQGPFDGEYGQYNKVRFEVNGATFSKIEDCSYFDIDYLEEGANVQVDFVKGERYTKVLSVKLSNKEPTGELKEMTKAKTKEAGHFVNIKGTVYYAK